MKTMSSKYWEGSEKRLLRGTGSPSSIMPSTASQSGAKTLNTGIDLFVSSACRLLN